MENRDQSLNSVDVRKISSYLAKEIFLGIHGIKPQIGNEGAQVHV